MSELFDTFGVTDVFATSTRIEDAGGGCIRIYNCVMKDGLLVAVGNAVVFPTVCMLAWAESAQEFARKVTSIAVHGDAVH